MVKICSFFLAIYKYDINNGEFKVYTQNAVNSFKKWHPDIETIIIGDDSVANNMNIRDISTTYRIEKVKDLLSSGYDKVIVLGADTITCSRLDEFINDNETSFLGAGDFPMASFFVKHEHVRFNLPHQLNEIYNVNADTMCFNKDVEFVDELLHLIKSEDLLEQFALQKMITFNNKYKLKIIDLPYMLSPFVYNVRSHGTIGTTCMRVGKDDKLRLHFGLDGPVIAEIPPMHFWKRIGDKLYNHDGKHVKLFHFAQRCEFIDRWFNNETKDFFEKCCDCVPITNIKCKISSI